MEVLGISDSEKIHKIIQAMKRLLVDNKRINGRGIIPFFQLVECYSPGTVTFYHCIPMSLSALMPGYSLCIPPFLHSSEPKVEVIYLSHSGFVSVVFLNFSMLPVDSVPLKIVLHWRGIRPDTAILSIKDYKIICFIQHSDRIMIVSERW